MAPDASKPEDFTDESEAYVRDSHFPGGRLATDKKSIFRDVTNLDEMVEAAENVPARGPNASGKYEREFDAGEVIGNVSKEWGAGRETTRYKIATDKYCTVMSIYPI